MNKDKCFSVTVIMDSKMVLGIVQAEDLAGALSYLEAEYPEAIITEISESQRIIL